MWIWGGYTVFSFCSVFILNFIFREFELRLPREEVQQVDQLRDHWQELLQLAEEVRLLLLKEKRANFEQELDKQVKGFVVEVIQFRNAFDAQGPAVPGITPAEAVTR